MQTSAEALGPTASPIRLCDYARILDGIEAAAATLSAKTVRARRSRASGRGQALIDLHNTVRSIGQEINLALRGSETPAVGDDGAGAEADAEASQPWQPLSGI
ncbi:hypothetical protein ACN27G_29525 [Plantactinospora sp. WMMB334]|uniref:hypothetical protein n=1 Tax=Plantactinospora sp. WMMB334 TaxID=3404119 RepID=UPI003B9310FA